MLAILETLLGVIPKPVLLAIILALGGVLAVLKYDNLTLTTDLAKEQAHVAILETYIATANADAQKQAADAERKARAAEQARAEREKQLLADAGSARAALERLRQSLGTSGSVRTPGAGGNAKADPAVAGTDLLTVGQQYVDLAEKCDRHVSDIKTLTEAWPSK